MFVTDEGINTMWQNPAMQYFLQYYLAVARKKMLAQATT